MGIREEIWQVVSEGMGIVVEGGEDGVSRSLYRQRDRIIADVLSILDEGECIFVGHRISEVYGENVWQPKGEGLEAGMDKILAKRGVEPGDHISIYMRKER